MKVTSASFVKSAFEPKDWPKGDVPEVAFLGRSNVGKSSLINSLLGVKGLARTSSTPGRTQALNFFLINARFHFVDLPGYGYARVPRAIRESWGEIVTSYLAKREKLVLSIQIVDSRHEPTILDGQLHEWLLAYVKPHVVVATKADKLSQNELRRNIGRAEKFFGTQGAGKVIAYSAMTGRGREQIWQAIIEALTVSH
ncbi:MAG: ribosome biogenesis GTP-binding protein YihA/YsxC [Acidobacteriota bacterium]|nr:ribosome biogenesis GTP-binding protein YihA/YsxC [Acidobacteriota bacterium]